MPSRCHCRHTSNLLSMHTRGPDDRIQNQADSQATPPATLGPWFLKTRPWHCPSSASTPRLFAHHGHTCSTVPVCIPQVCTYVHGYTHHHSTAGAVPGPQNPFFMMFDTVVLVPLGLRMAAAVEPLGPVLVGLVGLTWNWPVMARSATLTGAPHGTEYPGHDYFASHKYLFSG
jgi:hypothetical protein